MTIQLVRVGQNTQTVVMVYAAIVLRVKIIGKIIYRSVTPIGIQVDK